MLEKAGRAGAVQEKTYKILHIEDMQNDFVLPTGALPVPGADALVEPVNNFLFTVTRASFNLVLVTLDTHFPALYADEEEAGKFPLHCVHGTPGGQMAVDLSVLPENIPVKYMTKNVFDMWAKRPRHLEDGNPDKSAHDNLFRIMSDPTGKKGSLARDYFFENLRARPSETEVAIIGVAADYCVKYAALGYAQRGYHVVVLEDLTKGIKRDFAQVLAEDLTLPAGRISIRKSRAFNP